MVDHAARPGLVNIVRPRADNEVMLVDDDLVSFDFLWLLYFTGAHLMHFQASQYR